MSIYDAFYMYGSPFGCPKTGKTKITERTKELPPSNEDKAEMRKWAKKGKKALLAELLRLQKQCHSNYQCYEQEKERSVRNERGHNATVALLNGKLEGALAAIVAFRGEKKENDYE